MKREIYIDLMEKVMTAYPEEDIDKYVQRVMKNGLEEHGYPRLVANLGILVAYGRNVEYKDKFKKMMDLCCDEIPTAMGRNGNGVGNEFSVKEIVHCITEVEKSGFFDKSATDSWKEKIASLDTYKTYSSIASVPPEPCGNWAAFCAASEQTRMHAGLGGNMDFIDNQIKSQLFNFDENGMYRDPQEPIVYDLVTRLQLALALHFGFDGSSRAQLEEELMKSLQMTLEMQSVTGEIPFGGRSNQFLHNEAFYAALCEFYASLLKKQGDLNKAGEFKSAAKLAIVSVKNWLEKETIHHVKNYYDKESKFGCEEYAYFDKYMITCASWFYLAYLFADDDIKELPCPAIDKNYICQTADCFHLLMCKYNDYFIQIDTCGNPHYDASGLGRVHKRGVPSALCLSVPFLKKGNYEIDIENPSQLSICAGVKTDSGFDYTYTAETEYKIVEKRVEKEFVSVKIECSTQNGSLIHQAITVSDRGVRIDAQGDGEIEILFPVFDFDGEKHTRIFACENSVQVEYEGHKCTYSTDNEIVNKNKVYANRNGHYKAYAVTGQNSVSLQIEITR